MRKIELRRSFRRNHPHLIWNVCPPSVASKSSDVTRKPIQFPGMRKKRRPISVKSITRLRPPSDLDTIVGSIGKENWQSVRADKISNITTKPGVYLFTLPKKDRHCRGYITLLGRTFGSQSKRQLHITFSYIAQKLAGTSQVILYAGKAANLRDRLKKHLILRDDSTTSQMLQGLASQAVHHGEERNVETARRHLLSEATIYYYALGHRDENQSRKGHDPRTDCNVGCSYAADRDLLEIKLIAKYAPPFNIKAER